MQIIQTTDIQDYDQALPVFFLCEGQSLSSIPVPMPDIPAGVLEEEVFSGKVGHMHMCRVVRAVLVGLGPKEALNAEVFREAVGSLVRFAETFEYPAFAIFVDHLAALDLCPKPVVELVLALNLAEYRFAGLKSAEQERLFPETVLLCGSDPEILLQKERAQALASGITLARDLVNLPANIATPDYLAGEALKTGRAFGIDVQVLSPQEIEALGMGCFASVFRGSDTPARFLVLDTDPESTEKPVVFVGKGVTFDTGGISLKPSSKMHEMKGDMAGAAAILGYFRARGEAGLSGPRVVGLLPCTENVPGSRATKPGDVVTAINGLTVEVLNTDAEGRLILADALAYSARYSPRLIVDLATLTGACLVALGHKVAAVFASDAELELQLRAGGARVGERYWPMPLWDEYVKPLQRGIADLQNIASREGGAIFAAVFLKQFVPENVPWAHLDIAGPAWAEECGSLCQPGGTGFGVRTLWELLDTLS